MRERDIERKFVAEIKKNEGLAPKFISPGLNGMPDRLVLLPKGIMAFVEVKCEGGKLSPIQIKRKSQLESLGFKVYVIDDVGCIQRIIQEIGGANIGT